MSSIGSSEQQPGDQQTGAKQGVYGDFEETGRFGPVGTVALRSHSTPGSGLEVEPAVVTQTSCCRVTTELPLVSNTTCWAN